MRQVPQPLVRAQQWTIVVSVILGLVLRQPLLTTALLVVLGAGLVLGSRGNLIHRVARVALGPRLAGAPGEDAAQQRFNQSIAVTLLALAQVGFYALHNAVLGWILAGAVAVAAGIALAGFCVGCFIYLQLRLLRYRLQKAA